MRNLLRSLVFVVVSFAFLFFFTSKASAANLTVCNSGTCTGTTINAVLTGASLGDTITVQGAGVNPSNPYDPSGESWPVQFHAASNTLVCAGGASISQTNLATTGSLYLSTSSTVSDCSISNVSISTVYEIGADGQSPHGIQFLNNTFSTTATGTIIFGNPGVTDFLINGNTNIQSIEFSQNATNTRGTISNNTFRNKLKYTGNGISMMRTTASTTSITIRNNTFTNVISALGGTNSFFELDGANFTFASNTILSPAQSVTISGGAFGAMNFFASGTNYIGGNYIEVPTSTAVACAGINMQPSAEAVGAWSANDTIFHNTIVFGAGAMCTADTAGVSFEPSGGSFTRADLTLNATYNLIDNESTLSSNIGAINILTSSATSNLDITADYNGAYRFGFVARKKVDLVSTNLTNTHDISSNPYLRTANSDNSDNFTPSPFSLYLDVNGTNDIGASSAARRSTIYLNPTGTIDYSTVDATSTSILTDSLKSGDSVNFAAGDHNSFAINSTVATSSLTFTGANPLTTFIVARTGEDALKLTSVTSSVVSGLTLKSATSVVSSYSTSKILGTFNSLDYNQASGDLGSSAGSMGFFNGDVCMEQPTEIAADGTTVPGLDGTSDIHLVVFTDSGGARVTGLVPDNYLAGTGSIFARFNASCTGFLTAVAVATSTFTASGGNYTYHASPLASAGITLVGGVSTPAISTVLTGKAGLHLVSSSIIASNVIFDTNAYGAWIDAGSGSSTIINATSTGNTLYDFRYDINSTSTLSDVSFLTASTTFGSTAGFDVKYTSRIRVIDSDGNPITGLNTSSTPASVGSTRSYGTTDSLGYTTSYLQLVHRINGSSVSLTNSGKNPFTWTSGASGTYLATSTSASISSPYQTVTLVASQRSIGFGSSSGSSLESVTATSIHVELNATSLSDVTVNYAATGGTATGSGTDYTLTAGTATITAGETSTTIPITIVNDGVSEPGETIVITLSSPSGAILGTTTYTYTITDNDTAGVTLSKSSASVTEGGATDSYTVVLDTLPTSTVEVLLAPSNGQVTISTSTITFSPSNWNTPVTVTVTSVDDSTVEGTHSSQISHTASSTNYGYQSGLSIQTVAVTITDNDSSSSGGGGGGASSYGLPLPTPVISTTVNVLPPTVNVTFLDTLPHTVPDTTPNTPSSPNSVPNEPTPTASIQSVGIAQADAKTYKVTLSKEDAARIGAFIEFGSSPETKALGSGERRALLRDVYDTIGRAIPTSDLEKLAKGEIASTRNRDRELSQLPRVRQTFRTIFGHDPNFKAANENLAWNTLMYRIRFTRDLTKEKQGIVEFKTTFKKAPSDPFQWAAVRVLGYVD